MVPDDKIILIGSVLNNTRRPLKERFRALFTLKNIGGDIAVDCISRCFKDPSALLKHELAYCLGQMQDKKALQILISVLKDTSQEPMVRHEAGMYVTRKVTLGPFFWKLECFQIYFAWLPFVAAVMVMCFTI